MRVFCLQRRWGHFRVQGRAQGGGGLAEASLRVSVAAAPGRHIWLAHHGATVGPPGELSKAGLGLVARYKAKFWKAAYHVCGYWHVKPAQN